MIGARIKEQRQKIRYTQKTLADKVSVSPQVISNWERGYTEPSADDINRLSEALDCSSDYLLGRNNTKNSLSKADQDEAEFQAFANNPSLQKWYKELPKSKEEDLERLRMMWEILKKDSN